MTYTPYLLLFINFNQLAKASCLYIGAAVHRILKKSWVIPLYTSTNLQKPVKWDPEQENVSEELNQCEKAIDHPVRQPLCIIFFLTTLYGFYSETKNISYYNFILLLVVHWWKVRVPFWFYVSLKSLNNINIISLHYSIQFYFGKYMGMCTIICKHLKTYM